MKTSWRKLMAEVLGDDEILVCTLSEEELDVEFNGGYGGSEGQHFTAWSEEYVYFPVVYDGAEWVEWVPRNPCDKATAHVGGE